MSDSAERETRLVQLRALLAQAEAGEIQGFPTTEEAARRLRLEIADLEAADENPDA